MDATIAKKIEIFFTQFPKKQYRKDEIVLRADEDPSGIFYVAEGLVREFTVSSTGQETVLLLFTSPAIFPLSWLINDTPNSHFFDTPLKTALYKAPKDATFAFVKENPDVVFELLKRWDKRSERFMTRMIHHMSGHAYKRLITEIIVYAMLFGTTNKKNHRTCHITLTELATHAGMSRETVSREIKRLKEKQLIIVAKNKLTIPDLTALQNQL